MFFKTLEKSKITSKFNSLIIEKMIDNINLDLKNWKNQNLC